MRMVYTMNKKGFTLAELLIVVAIIAVLVAIAIPVFTSQLEKSREATDLANVRGAYAQLMTEVNSGNYDAEYTVPLVQTQDKWQTEGKINIAGIQKACLDGEEKFRALVAALYHMILSMIHRYLNGEIISIPEFNGLQRVAKLHMELIIKHGQGVQLLVLQR